VSSRGTVNEPKTFPFSLPPTHSNVTTSVYPCIDLQEFDNLYLYINIQLRPTTYNALNHATDQVQYNFTTKKSAVVVKYFASRNTNLPQARSRNAAL